MALRDPFGFFIDLLNPFSDMHQIKKKPLTDAELVAKYEIPYQNGVSFAPDSMGSKMAANDPDFLRYWDKTTMVKDGKYIREYPLWIDSTETIGGAAETVGGAVKGVTGFASDLLGGNIGTYLLIAGAGLILFEYSKTKVGKAA